MSAMTFASEIAVLHALAKRYAAPEYAFLQHVRNGTGYSRKTTRTADALAMSLYPSRGLELHGFEVKVSRADWVHEKENPEKAEEISKFCDRWWIAIGDEKIVQLGELSPTWGLLIPKGDKLVVKVEAPKLEAKPLDRLMIAAILRKATEGVVPKASIEMLVHEKVNAEVERRMSKSEAGHLQLRIDYLESLVKTFEERSGVDISETWRGEKIADAVRAVMKSTAAVENAKRGLEHPERILVNALKNLRDARKEIEK